MTADRIILWRHGRTAHNHDGIYQGQLDTPMDQIGRAQAAAAAAVLAPIAHRVASGGGPLRIICSDLARARETAEALTAVTGVPLVPDQRLREIDAGSWQGRTRAEIEAAGMGEQLAAWRRGEDVAAGGGERRSEAAARALGAIQQHAAELDGGLLIVAAHGGVLRGAALGLLDLPMDRWHALGGLGNCRWAEIERGRAVGGWRLTAYNVGAPEDQTWDAVTAVATQGSRPA